MLNYIASENTSQIIQKVCKDKNILILYETKERVDILKYLKETKVNFNLIKYFIIEINNITNSEKEIIDSIYNFNRLHQRIRIIVIAQGLEEQNTLLTELYNKEIYNIINEVSELEIEESLIKCLSEGMQKKDAKKFEKVEEIIQKENKTKKEKSKNKPKKEKEARKEKTQISDMPTNKVYLFSLLLEAITRLVKFICYILIFVLTSIGLTILLNSELRNIVFQIFGLK